MTAQHTPGPWKVIASPHGKRYRCVQYGKDDRYTSLEMEPADARLTAAAPELLAELKRITSAIELRNYFAAENAVEFARAAIAKATDN